MRKVVTVVFADLVGSTAFGEQVDAESAREVMARYYDMVQRVVALHRGAVAKFVGDGVMAVFGIPEVAEDDADRAVAAGLVLQREFDAIRSHVHDRYDVEVGLRVGINTGEVVIADDDADLVGDAINTAARLEATCTPGRVLVGEDTWRLTRARTRYEVLGEVTVKGKAAPIATFQVVGRAGDVDEVATPFVGREAELDELRRVLATAIEQRSLELVTVIGAPGVGKTRLALELARAQGDTVRCFDLRCERAGTATFAPIAELLRDAAGIESDFTTEQTATAIEKLVGDRVHDRDRVIELLGAFVGTGTPRSTEEMFFAARRLLELVAAHRPALVVVDDIQWSEPVFLDLLEHLADWVRNQPIMIVALARPEIRDIRPSLTSPNQRVSAVLSVEGLDPAATERLAAQLLGGDELPSELAGRLPASTEGNPLFVRELVRMLVDDGVVTRTEVGWEMAVDAESVQVPPTIQSLLSTRVERMPEDERRFIELASVVGSEFPRGAVDELLDGASTAEVDATVERLRRKEILESTGSYWGDEPVLRFHHVLIRDAAYRRLLKRARVDFHLRVGEWTERTAKTLVGEHESTIAFHFEQCHDYRCELGMLDDETKAVGDRAAALLHPAAARALERDDLPAAGALARRALARLSPDAPSRPDLLVLACEALFGSGDVNAGREVLEQLDEIATEPRLRAWSACFHAQLIIFTSPKELSVAERSVNDAAELLAELGDDAGVAKARQVRAGALGRLGRVGDCEAELDLALTAARAADDRRRVTAVLGSAPVAALWGPSPVPRAGGRCLDVIRLLRITTGSPAVEATSVRCQAVLEALRGRFDTARTMLESSRSTAQELGLRHGLLETELYAGIVELLAGKPAAAEPHLREAYAGLGRLGIGADAGQAAAYLARALLLQGQLDEAEELAAASDALAGQNPQTLIAARSAQAEILSARGDHESAVALAEDAVALAKGRDIIVDHARACLVLAQVRRAAGDHERAQQAQAEGRRLFDLKGATVDMDTHLRSDAEVAAAGAVGDRNGDGLGSRIHDRTVLAVRGDDLTLSAVELRTGRGALEPMLILEMAVGDETRPVARFERSDLRSAVAELDRLYLESLPPELNETYRLQMALADGVNSNDPAVVNQRFHEILAPDFVGLDHRPMGWGRQDKRALIERQASRVADIDPSFVGWMARIHRFESAGMLWELAADSGHGDHRWSRLALSMFREGQVWRLESFAVEQLPEAHARFDQLLGGHGQPGLTNRCTVTRAQLGDAYNRQDWDAYLGLLAKPYVYEARHTGPRAGSQGNLTADERRADAFSRVDAGFTELAGEVVAIRGEHLALERISFTTPDGLGASNLIVFEIDDDEKLCRIIRFDADDMNGAIAELDRLYFASLDPDHDGVSRVLTALGGAAGNRDVAGWDIALARFADLREGQGTTHSGAAPVATPAALENAATRSGDRQVALLVSGDLSRRPNDLFSPEFVLDDRRRPLGAGQWIGDEAIGAALDAFDGMSPDAIRATTLAVRGDRLALVHATFDTDGFENELVAIESVNEAGLRDRTVLFDVGDLAEAFAELDQSHLEGEAAGDARALGGKFAADRALNAADWDTLESLLPDQVRVVDHRPVGFGELDRAGLLAYLQEAPSVAGPRVHGAAQFHRVSPVGHVVTTFVGGLVEGRLGDRWDHTDVLVRRGDRLHIEYFPAGEVEAALARFDELTIDELTAEPDSTTSVEIPNTCAEQTDRWAALWSARDWEALEQLLAPDLEIDQRRSGPHRASAPGRAGVLENAKALEDLGFDSLEQRLLAVRADSFSVHEQRFSTPEGAINEFLSVVEVDDTGRFTTLTYFDVDAVPEAMALLDERYAATIEGNGADLVRLSNTHQLAVRTHDWDALGEILATDFEFADRRALALVELDRDGYLERMRAAADVGYVVTWWCRTLERLTETAGVATITSTARTDAGDVLEWDFIGVTEMRDGRFTRFEYWDLSEMDGALARFDELRSTSLGENAATRVSDRVSEIVRTGDLRELERVIHRDAVAADHALLGEGVGGRQDFIDAMKSWRRIWGDDQTDHGGPVALRGDRLAVMEYRFGTPGGWSIDRLGVVEVDADGLLMYLNFYDPEDRELALTELEQRGPT